MCRNNYYELLEVRRDAGGAEIKRAFRRLAFRLHPDRNPGDAEAELKFRSIREAYDILRNPKTRAEYDKTLQALQEEATRQAESKVFGSGFQDVQDRIFGGGRRVRAGAGPISGEDLRLDLTLSSLQAEHGGEYILRVPKFAVCGDCSGSGMMRGTSLKSCAKCHGEGKVLRPYGLSTIGVICPFCLGRGHTVSVADCPRCRGVGLAVEVKELGLRLPAGIMDGESLRFPGLGVPASRGSAGPDGDLYIIIHVHNHTVFKPGPGAGSILYPWIRR